MVRNWFQLILGKQEYMLGAQILLVKQITLFKLVRIKVLVHISATVRLVFFSMASVQLLSQSKITGACLLEMHLVIPT